MDDPPAMKIVETEKDLGGEGLCDWFAEATVVMKTGADASAWNVLEETGEEGG